MLPCSGRVCGRLAEELARVLLALDDRDLVHREGLDEPFAITELVPIVIADVGPAPVPILNGSPRIRECSVIRRLLSNSVEVHRLGFYVHHFIDAVQS